MKFLLLTLLAVGCTSLPSGKPQLKKSIRRDKKEASQIEVTPSQLNRGRPIYIEAQSYPQLMNGGHIIQGGKIYIYTGREELRLDEIISEDKKIISSDEVGEKISSFVVTIPPLPENSFVYSLDENKTSELSLEPETYNDVVNLALSSVADPDFLEVEMNNMPLTPGSMTKDETKKLKESSVKDAGSCVKPLLLKQGGCDTLQVKISFSDCINKADVRKTQKEYCFKDRARFSHISDGMSFTVYLRSSDGFNYSQDGEIQISSLESKRKI